jgi:poly-gamma-glutamate synthesis protein (capsule biosynthesis protein)
MKKRKSRNRKKKAQFYSFFIWMTVVALLGIAIAGVAAARNRSEAAMASDTLGESDAKAAQETEETAGIVQEAVLDAETPDEADADTDDDMDADETDTEGQKVQTVTMAFGGDICFHDAYANMNALKSRGGKIESSLSEDLLEEMRQADILMLNNEFTYSDRGTPLPDKAFAFRSRPENVELLHEMGVDIVSLANNHVYDWGEDALLDTLDTLKESGIPYVGAGRNLDEASTPYYYEINGRTIAFISATQVERNENPDTRGATEVTAGTFRCFTQEEFARLTAVVEEADRQADLTVVYIHWGTENTDELHWAQEWQAPELVKAGADLIVGDHPHCLQGIDYIEGVPVFYSLGNFWFNSKTLDTGLLKVTFDTDGELSCQFLPAKQHDCRTDLMTGEEKQRILDYLQCISPDVTIDGDGYIRDEPYSGPEIDYNAVQRLPVIAEPQPETQTENQTETQTEAQP